MPPEATPVDTPLIVCSDENECQTCDAEVLIPFTLVLQHAIFYTVVHSVHIQFSVIFIVIENYSDRVYRP